MGLHEAPSANGRHRSRSRNAKLAITTRAGDWSRPVAFGVFGALIVGSPLLLGGVLPWTVDVIATAAWLSLAAVATLGQGQHSRVPFLPVLICSLALWTALQALPLSCGLISLVAPDSARETQQVRAALGAIGPHLCTLSRDPGATHQEMVKGVAIVCTFLAAWSLSAAGERRKVLFLVAVSTVVTSVVAIAHAAFELDDVFGIYRPMSVKRVLLLAPIMNTNNLGGFTAVGAPLCLGLAYRATNPNLRLIGYGAFVVTTITTVLSLSRGAISQLLITLVVMVWLLTMRRGTSGERNNRSRLREVSIIGGIILSLSIAVYFLGADVAHEFENGDLSKLGLIANALHFAAQHPWVGVGRGAFASSFVSMAGETTRFAYPENIVAMWASEWGIPASIALLSGLIYSLGKVLQHRRSISRLGALTALVGLAGQNCVDFGLELPGIAVVASALLAAVVAPAWRKPDGALPSWQQIRVLNVGVLALGAITVLTLGLAFPRETIPAFEDTLRRKIATHDHSGFEGSLQSAVALHPSEPIFAILAASESITRGDKAAGRWINRAMQLAPGWATPHILAYRWLWLRGKRAQALLELRSAAEIDTSSVREAACTLAAIGTGATALYAAPLGKERRSFLEMTARCVPVYDPHGQAVDDALVHDFPDSLLGRERQAWRLFSHEHFDESLAAVASMQALYPAYGGSVLARARILASLGRFDAAIDEVTRGAPKLDPTQQAEAFGLQALAYAQIGRADAAERAVSQVRRLAVTNVVALAASYALAGQVQLYLRRPGQAFAEYREAYRIIRDTKYLKAIAQLAMQLGDRPQALWAYMNLCQREPAEAGWCARRDELLAPPTPNSGQ